MAYYVVTLFFLQLLNKNIRKKQKLKNLFSATCCLQSDLISFKLLCVRFNLFHSTYWYNAHTYLLTDIDN